MLKGDERVAESPPRSVTSTHGRAMQPLGQLDPRYTCIAGNRFNHHCFSQAQLPRTFSYDLI